MKSRKGLRRPVAVSMVVTLLAALMAMDVTSAWGQTSAAPSIKFLSPTSFAGEMPTLTDENAGVNTAYRLSAWVAGAPSDSLVEFELIPGESDPLTKPITIGAGSPVTQDTFEYQWDIAEGPTGVVEGTHTLKTTLYNADGDELAVDRMTVNVIHGGSTKPEGEAAIDLQYPVSGGPLGYFFGQSDKANSVLESKKLSGSAVQAFFTTSAPGTPPVWKVCNPSESDTNFGDGVRCTYPVDDPETKELNEAIDPTAVTAVALKLSRDAGSADVARVLPYRQEVGALGAVLHGQTATGTIDVAVAGSAVKQKAHPDAPFPCSDWVRLRLTDQVGRPIAGANLDMHAQGPTDQLKFHTSYLAALNSPHSVPPSEGHSFPEEGARCVSTHDTIGAQGEHGLGGLPDRKHVETASGTRDSGLFDTRLQTDQAGASRLLVWAEKKDDDKFCSDERNGSVSMTLAWGDNQEAPAAEEPVDCALPSPGPSPDPEPIDGSRTVRMEAAATAVRKGGTWTAVGSISAADELCEVGQTLKLRAKRPGAKRFRTVASGISDHLGLYRFEVKVERTRVYRIVAPVAGDCVKAVSEAKKVRAI